MAITRRVFVSMPHDKHLTSTQNDLKWGVIDRIEQLGFMSEIFFDPRGTESLAGGKAWSALGADAVMRKCAGAVVIGLPRWSLQSPDGPVLLPTEFCHYEGAIAYTLGLPLLALVQHDVERRVVFDNSFKGMVGEFAPTAGREWLDSADFRTPFTYWKNKLLNRRDVFLGYCSSSKGTAKNLKRFLETQLQATVLDWMTDLAVSGTILEEIEEATDRCSAGIFLFTQDDKLTDDSASDKAVPRDNVVFEAGYFMQAKGRDRVLIVRERGAKMPADLGGTIYASLDDKSDIGPIEDLITRFIARL